MKIVHVFLIISELINENECNVLYFNINCFLPLSREYNYKHLYPNWHKIYYQIIVHHMIKIIDKLDPGKFGLI